MPIGIVSDDEFEKELNNSSVEIDRNGVPTIGRSADTNTIEIDTEVNLEVITGEIETLEKGRGEGNREVPESLRAILGETSILEGRQEALALASEFGISDSSVSAYKSGKTSTASPLPEKKLKNHLEIIRKNATKRAGRKLLAALDCITPDKLEEAPAGVLAVIAKNLSGVIRDMEPEIVPNTTESGVKFIVFAPQINNESKYESITVQE